MVEPLDDDVEWVKRPQRHLGLEAVVVDAEWLGIALEMRQSLSTSGHVQLLVDHPEIKHENILVRDKLRKVGKNQK